MHKVCVTKQLLNKYKSVYLEAGLYIAVGLIKQHGHTNIELVSGYVTCVHNNYWWLGSQCRRERH